MENNNKGSGIFLGVIGVATLIVAIIGATFAFFGAETTGGTDRLTAASTKLALGFEDNTDGIKTNLIPAEYWIAEYAAQNEAYKGVEDKECIDENGNEICGVYTFTVGNSSVTTAQTLYATFNSVTNDFSDLYFRIYDENDEEVVQPTLVPESGKSVNLDGLEQILLASSNDETIAEDAKPSDYTKVETGSGETYQSNTRTYRMVIWIEENNTDQTETNSGKTFAGSLTFTTANDTKGVTGVIAAAQKAEGASDAPPTDPEGSSPVTTTPTE